MTINLNDNIGSTKMKNIPLSFPFDIQNDRSRFQLTTVQNQKGYYDLVEKKFISAQIIKELIDELKPDDSFEIMPEDDVLIEKIKKRINQNLSFMQKNTRDSYSTKLLKYFSNRFLSSQSEQNILTVILFVDIVKSTNLANTLAPHEMSSLIRVFSQEISILISKHSGFVLKYAGDAAIAYFPISNNANDVYQNAVKCAKSMNMLIKHAINPAFVRFGLPEIEIRVGLESGNDQIVFFGPEPDLIGSTITMTSKIYPLAEPSQIAIGEEIFKKLNGTTNQFFQLNSDSKKIPYINSNTGKEYAVYLSKEVFS
jgi:class 3 adenylate cyclase